MVDLRHKVFMEAALNKSFSRAAELLFMSQPAVSKHIKLLEDSYRTKLFERKGLQVELTAAGTFLLKQLLTVRKTEEETLYKISSIRNREEAQGLLKLGASTTVALYIVPKVMPVFQKQFPLIQISLLNRNSEIVLSALLKHEIDLAITEGSGKLINVSYQTFISDKIVAVCSSKSAVASKKKWQLRELLTLPVALRERGSGTLDALEIALIKHGIKISDLRVMITLGGTEALKNYIIESDCVGFLPLRAVVKELKYGELEQLQFSGLDIERNFYFMQRKGENISLNKQFIRSTKEVYNLK